MSQNRDQAVALATRLFQKLFERVWLPWSPAIERAIVRLVDLIIAAAAEQARAQDIEMFERELETLAPAPRPTRKLHDDDEHEPDSGMRNFEEWKRQRRA